MRPRVPRRNRNEGRRARPTRAQVATQKARRSAKRAATALALVDASKVRRFRRALLAWFGREGRDFFWRKPSVPSFHVLVAEILLSKTRAELVDPIAGTLLRDYPTPSELAAADPGDLERLLYPLGLHRKRARYLISCAAALAERSDGVPATVDELLELPYVGKYAANAIACVAFDAHVAVLDANVSRVYQRVFSVREAERLDTAVELWAVAKRVLPREGAKVFNWAILDLGGTVCTARSPACDRCPVASLCDRVGTPGRVTS